MHNRFVPIKEFPNYLINNEGKIWSKPRKIFRKVHKNKDGHVFVVLCKDGKMYNRYIHQLLLKTFVGPRPEGWVCRHLNGDPADNRLENLCWGTPSENQKDAVKHGTSAALNMFGEKCPSSKLTEREVKEIKWLLKHSTLLQREVAVLYNITQANVHCINAGKSWKHL